MASFVRNEQRGTWQVQWHDGAKWTRVTVARKRAGWKAGDPLPKKPPAEVLAAVAAYQRKEDAARLSRPTAADETVEGFLADHLAYFELSRRPESVRQLRGAVGFFAAFCKAAKVKTLAEVTPDVADRFVRHRSKGRSYCTVRTNVALLAGAWGRAVKLRRVADNPWANVEIHGQAGKRHSSWTPDEYTRLLAASRPWLRDVLTLGVNTGLRVTALTRLEWRDVAWNGGDGPGLGTVTVRPELDKAKAGYTLPQSEACHELLSRLKAERGEKPEILSGQSGRAIRAVTSLRQSIHDACERAGLPRPDSPCHAMRRTFGRWAVLGHLTGRPVPLYVASRWMGHHSVSQTEVYLDLSDVASQQWMTQGAGG